MIKEVCNALTTQKNPIRPIIDRQFGRTVTSDLSLTTRSQGMAGFLSLTTVARTRGTVCCYYLNFEK